MAKKDSSEPSNKEPGRIKQMWQIFQVTREHDSHAIWIMLVAFLIPLGIGIVLGFLFSPDNGILFALWVFAGVLAGFLTALIIFGRRAEKAAYSQIEGKPGAVGAVLRSALRRSWIGNEMPVAVNPKTHDAVYRAVGRGGIALVGEGPESRIKRMLDEERRKISRVVPNVPVTLILVGTGNDAIPLWQLSKKLRKIKSTLTKTEVVAVNNRLNTLTTQPPLPKGIDPFKVRPQRAR